MARALGPEEIPADQNRTWKKPRLPAGALMLCIAASGCAGEYLPFSPTRTHPSDLDGGEAASAPGARISFHYMDFYSLTDPNSYSCAGDARNFYEPFELDSSGLPAKFPSSAFSGSRATTRPSFIRNASVDITDSNVDVTANEAYSCSLGESNGPPVSNCATFDYGALSGVSTTMSGSLLVIGGIQETNYAMPYDTTLPRGRTVSCGPLVPLSQLSGAAGEADLNVCPTDMYSVGIETLPASAVEDEKLVPGLSEADGPISSWSKLESNGGPQGIAGAAIAYNTDAGRLVVYGGSESLPGQAPTGPAAPSTSTYVFNARTQAWNSWSTLSATATSEMQLAPYLPDPDGSPLYLSRTPGARAYFGYAAVPRLGLANPDLSTFFPDTTDRIVSVGGLTGVTEAGEAIHSRSVHKFNPTFGPEFVVTNLPGGGGYRVWAEALPTQAMSSPPESGRDWYLLRPGSTSPAYTAVEFGMAPLRATTGIPTFEVGSFVTVGGFTTDSDTTARTPNDGLMRYLLRTNLTERRRFLVLPSRSFTDLFAPSTRSAGTIEAPVQLGGFATEGGSAEEQIPDLGGGHLLPGFDLANNQIVSFGGIECKSYRLASTDTDDCDTTLTSGGTVTRIWNVTPVGGGSPLQLNGDNQINTLSGTEPKRAGMAAARGFDGNGNAVIVAWGGTDRPGDIATSDSGHVYLLSEDAAGGAGDFGWRSIFPSGVKPTPKLNASMIFSHVTGKFYLFGGFDPLQDSNSNETWELSVTGNCNDFTGGSTCSVAWRLLTGGGLTCSPSCSNGPSARRGHRMTEVNYSRKLFASEYTDVTGADPDARCTSDHPCSFGIFMEGGTTNDASVLGDRWMFDPTANGGNGHWQRVNNFPPRKLSAMASFTYQVPGSERKVRRVVMFGGETGLHSPNSGKSGHYYLAPTLGDTAMFDLDSNQWSRTRLYGRGVHFAASVLTAYDALPEIEKRQIFRADQSPPGAAWTHHAEFLRLAPPPLAGHMMVTRTRKGPMSDPDSKALNVQEVYMLGGRFKDGSYQPLSDVWKFCPGSTGEDYSSSYDGTCDSHDSQLNPDSPNPSSDFAGRWLYKPVPDSDGFDPDLGIKPADFTSFMGAATYDSRRDRVVLFGGIQPAAANGKVTEARTLLSASGEVYEYTFPTRTLRHSVAVPATDSDRALYFGAWRAIPSCAGSSAPDGRYGHSMHYDGLRDQILLFGGYDTNGGALTQDWKIDGSSVGYSIPQLWKGVRRDHPDDPSEDCYDWSPVDSFANSFSATNPQYPLGGLGHMSAAFITGEGYNSGYYSTFDSSCERAGPIAVDDFSVNKLMAGGAYIDIDRNQLGQDENLLLHLTFIPLGPDNVRSNGLPFELDESAVFRVHLEKTGLETDLLRSMQQPRYLHFHDVMDYPKPVQTLSVLAPPTGSIRQEQVYLPITMDPGIDRIRIERFSGSAILIEAAVFRMGRK